MSVAEPRLLGGVGTKHVGVELDQVTIGNISGVLRVKRRTDVTVTVTVTAASRGLAGKDSPPGLGSSFPERVLNPGPFRQEIL